MTQALILIQFFSIAGSWWSEVLLVYSLGCSVLSIFAMTLHRYLIVVHSYRLTQDQVYMILTTIWAGLLVGLGLSSLFQNAESVVGLQSSQLYCYIAMDSTYIANIVSSTIALFFLAGIIMFICYAYAHIVKRYMDLLAAKKQKKREGTIGEPEVFSLVNIGEAAPPLTRTPTIGENETKLIIKAMAFIGSFTGIWSFFIGKAIYEIALHTQVSVEYDIVIVLLLSAYPILNGLILYMYDAKSRNSIRELFYRKSLFSILESRRRRIAFQPPQLDLPNRQLVVPIGNGNANADTAIENGTLSINPSVTVRLDNNL